MKEQELIHNIAKETGFDEKLVSIVTQNFIFEIKKQTIKHNRCSLRGFGTFFARKRAEKVGRNFLKNKNEIIPEHYKPSFKPSSKFKKLLK